MQLHRYNWNQAYCATEYRKLMLSYSGTWTMAGLPEAQPLIETVPFGELVVLSGEVVE